MQSYPDSPQRVHLRSEHRHHLFIESGIDPEVAAERGYATIKRCTGLLSLKKYQRRPGLLIPIYSSDGQTESCQLRPDNPRKDKKGKALKYETPGSSKAILDVHPRMLDEVRNGNRDLYVTEGIKKADSLTSRGLPTIGLIGVWNWQRGGEMLPCWDHVRLEGRRVYIVFDSDVMTKENVQLALGRLVAALEGRDADVLVVYLPDAPDGGKQGVDDFLATASTVNELKMLARKFEQADIGNIRMSRDGKLRVRVKDLERRWWSEEWKGRSGHSERDVALKLIEAATRSGKIHVDGLRVKVSWGALQVGAKVSRRTLAKALTRLEERGLLYRDNEGRKPDKTGAFVLRAKVDHKGTTSTGEEKVMQELRECDPGGLPLRASGPDLPDAPRLRWSQPKYTPKKRGFVKGTRKVRESKPLPARERIERLGKVRGAVVDALQVAGGELPLAKLCEVLHRTRARDVRRRILPMLDEAGVIEVAGDVIRLTHEWREALEAERREKGEASYEYTLEYIKTVNEVEEVVGEKIRVVGADELAEDRRKRKSRAYRERDKAPVSKPSAAGLAAVDRARAKRTEERVNEHEERQAKARVAELEAKRFAKKFVNERLRELGRIRLGLLQEILSDVGGIAMYALPAAKSIGCAVERLPEFNNAEFVFAPAERVA